MKLQIDEIMIILNQVKAIADIIVVIYVFNYYKGDRYEQYGC